MFPPDIAATSQRRLRPGESSVSIEFGLTRRGTLVVTGELRAVARWRASTGRVHRLEVDAFDDGGLVASGAHSRAA